MSQRDWDLPELAGETVDEERTPDRSPVDLFAGGLTHLYPDPDDTRRFLAEERASWGTCDTLDRD